MAGEPPKTRADPGERWTPGAAAGGRASLGLAGVAGSLAAHAAVLAVILSSPSRTPDPGLEGPPPIAVELVLLEAIGGPTAEASPTPAPPTPDSVAEAPETAAPEEEVEPSPAESPPDETPDAAATSEEILPPPAIGGVLPPRRPETVAPAPPKRRPQRKPAVPVRATVQPTAQPRPAEAKLPGPAAPKAASAAPGPRPEPAQTAAAAAGVRDAFLDAYQSAVFARLRAKHRYPRALRRRGIGGAGRVEIRIAEDGRLLSWRLIESAGHPDLDAEIARLIERTAPFPPFPPELERSSIRFGFPVRFTRN